MRPSPLIAGCALSVVLIVVVLLVGGPLWATVMGLVAVFLVVLLTFGTRQ